MPHRLYFDSVHTLNYIHFEQIKRVENFPSIAESDTEIASNKTVTFVTYIHLSSFSYEV